MGIRKELIEEGRKIEMDREGLVMGRVKWGGGKRWRIIGVYARKEVDCKERIFKELERDDLERWARKGRKEC